MYECFLCLKTKKVKIEICYFNLCSNFQFNFITHDGNSLDIRASICDGFKMKHFNHLKKQQRITDNNREQQII